LKSAALLTIVVGILVLNSQTARAENLRPFECNSPDFSLTRTTYQDFKLRATIRMPAQGYTYHVEDVQGRNHLGISKKIIIQPPQTAAASDNASLDIEYDFSTDQSPVTVYFSVTSEPGIPPRQIACTFTLTEAPRE
jgi:hypothetical protein